MVCTESDSQNGCQVSRESGAIQIGQRQSISHEEDARFEVDLELATLSFLGVILELIRSEAPSHPNYLANTYHNKKCHHKVSNDDPRSGAVRAGIEHHTHRS